MPVESFVAPAGPSAPIVPIAPGASGVSLGSPAMLDLRGGIPLLPSPVPGLFGPALGFVGGVPETAAVQPEAAAAAASPATASPAAAALGKGKAFDKTPALPAKASPGGFSIAVSRDRRAAGSVPDNETSPAGSKTSQAAVEPEPSGLARPEQAAGAGREFFDRSREKDRGSLESGAPGRAPALVAATMLDGGAFGPSLGRSFRPAAPDASAAFGSGHGAAGGAGGTALGEPSSEVLHDAVASAPGAAPAPAVAGLIFGAASANGGLAASRGPASGPGWTSSPSAPRPLALDLSGSGLIVRVRSALESVIAPAPSAAALPAAAVPGPSTAWIERGAMLEAFSVSRAYAKSVAEARFDAFPDRGLTRENAPSTRPWTAAAEKPAAASLWWAWLIAPFLAAAFKSLR